MSGMDITGIVNVYDGNGDEIPTYTAGVGWHEKESKAERKYMGLCRQLTMMRSERQGRRSMLTLLVWKYRVDLTRGHEKNT